VRPNRWVITAFLAQTLQSGIREQSFKDTERMLSRLLWSPDE
jgi:hypothetical protein